MICVPVIQSHANDFLAAVDEAKLVAGAIELRFDYLVEEELPRLLAALPAHLHDFKPTLIFTFRPREQGGHRDVTLADRRNFWRTLAPELKATLSFADFELDLMESSRDDASPIPWNKVICSYHDFMHTPDNLTEIYDRLARMPARVIKIATHAEQITDCVRIFEIIERANTRPVIALAMGQAGLATRVLALSRGAMLTFAALRYGAETASGQLNVTELRDLYRIESLSRESEIYGVIGDPVSHSHSPAIHNSVFAATGRNAVYIPFEVKNVGEFIRLMVHPRTRQLEWNLRGLSVTIPHKLAIGSHLDVIDPFAARVGAVNTIVIEGDQLRGYNTDVAAAMKPLDELIDLRGARVAVLGAGGAARAVCYGLIERGAKVTIYARNVARASELKNEFEARIESLDHFAGEAEIVINCTPIGMHGHSEGKSPIRAEALDGVKLIYDLIYNPEETALLANARAAGCQTLGGFAMLIAQAAEQYRLWTST